MTDSEKVLNVKNTILSMKEQLNLYQDSESKRAKISVLNVIEMALLYKTDCN